MRKLVLHVRGEEPRDFPIGKQRILIGRQADCDIHLDDPATSAQHAAIVTIGQNSYLQDMNSTNGTMVNGAPVKKHTLKNGDVLLVGRTHLTFHDEPDAPAAKKTNPDEVVPGMGPLLIPATRQKVEKAASQETLMETTITVNPVDRMIQSIRDRRATTGGAAAEEEKMVSDEEWKRVVELANTFKARVGSDRRVRSFAVSDSPQQVVIRVLTRGGEAERSFTIARNHPDGRRSDTLWLLCQGRPDQSFRFADDVIQELISTLSYLVS